MLTCKEIARILSLSFDRKLTGWERFKLRLHLLLCRCPLCKGNRHDLNLIRDAIQQKLKNEKTQTPKFRLPAEARQRIQKFLNANDQK